MSSAAGTSCSLWTPFPWSELRAVLSNPSHPSDGSFGRGSRVHRLLTAHVLHRHCLTLSDHPVSGATTGPMSMKAQTQ